MTPTNMLIITMAPMITKLEKNAMPQKPKARGFGPTGMGPCA